jgi:ABC-2 type transport system ATP-binding protein
MQLTLDRLTKQYGSKIALDRINAIFEPGIYGLLGANGAGKTTMMRLICDILKPTSGEVTFNGTNIREMGASYRAVIGYLPQDFGYYPNFTAMNFLLYMASLKGLNARYAKEKSLELLETLNLSEVKDKKIKTFSGGMKQRLGIAQAFLNDPQILILDEPTAGLDPKERVKFRNLISSFAENKIVILSTHIVTDIEYIADEILMIKNGALLKKGAENDIIQEISGKVWECRVSREEADHLEKRYTICNSKAENGTTILRIVSDSKPCNAAALVSPCLEDLYLHYFHGEV